MFTLLKTPAAYDLPTAQPACLEAMLYLKQVQAVYPTIQLSLDSNKSQTPTTTTESSPLDSDGEEQPTTATTPTSTSAPIKYVNNEYWMNGLDSTNRPTSTTLPLLHHQHAIVPTHNIIPYLKTNLYDIDAYMTPAEVATIEGLRMLALKLQTIVQFIISQFNSYPIAANVFFPIRWRVRAFYKELCEQRAQNVGIWNEDEATVEISYIFATLAARLGDATWFGPQNKMCSLDFTVASAVAFCLATKDLFLTELLYRYYPTLVAHCHNVLVQTLGSEDKLETQVDRHTAPLRKQSLVALLGEKFANPVDQTPRKKSTRRRSARSSTTTVDDDEQDEGANDDNITSFDANLDETTTENATGLQAVTQEQLLQPDDVLPYLTRHSIGPQDQSIGDASPSQRIKLYSTQAWLGTTKWLNELAPADHSWAHQFFLIGALAITSIFIIIKAKGQSDEEYAKVLKEIEVEEATTNKNKAIQTSAVKSTNESIVVDFHRPGTPLPNHYSQKDQNSL